MRGGIKREDGDLERCQRERVKGAGKGGDAFREGDEMPLLKKVNVLVAQVDIICVSWVMSVKSVNLALAWISVE